MKRVYFHYFQHVWKNSGIKKHYKYELKTFWLVLSTVGLVSWNFWCDKTSARWFSKFGGWSFSFIIIFIISKYSKIEVWNIELDVVEEHEKKKFYSVHETVFKNVTICCGILILTSVYYHYFFQIIVFRVLENLWCGMLTALCYLLYLFNVNIR
jgi:hypothetical protein